MARVLKLTGLGLFALLIILQFFRPERNNIPPEPALDMLSMVSPPEATAQLLRKACYDCHSNQTDYPWYGRIAPLSWYLSNHISRGKEGLNFSVYGQLDKAEKIGFWADLCDVLDDGTMPLQSYAFLHKEARLTKEEREMLCMWTEEEALKLMRE